MKKNKKLETVLSDLAKKASLKFKKQFKKCVRDILTEGVTQDTLLNFYTLRSDYGISHKDDILRNYIQEAFDEVDPPNEN